MLSKRPKCTKCESDMRYDFEYVNATLVGLHDLNNYNDMDKMRVQLFDNDTLDIIIGDTVKVIGTIEIIQTKYGKGKAVSIMFADKIIYESKDEIKLSSADIQALTRSKDANYNNLIPKLIEITAPSVIGYPLMKEGLLLSAVNTVIDSPKRKKRINMILIGPAGLDKTGFLYAATELVPNSSFEGALSSSGLSLTAIVVYEDDTKIPSLGPIPRCQGAISAINELNRMNPKDQWQLLDPTQECLISLNKYNTHAKIRSSTTIIAAANPIGDDWVEGIPILNQVTIIPQLMDRFDLKFILKKNKDFEASRKYADLKTLDTINDDNEEQIQKQKNDTEFLQKYILYAKQFKPKITEQTRQMINEYFAVFENTNTISKRPFETLYNLALARAKLKFKNEIDADDVTETIEFYSRQMTTTVR
jgi:replicative DNA helicase Mcm